MKIQRRQSRAAAACSALSTAAVQLSPLAMLGIGLPATGCPMEQPGPSHLIEAPASQKQHQAARGPAMLTPSLLQGGT